jgi:DMSO/TMAO reductase YedYZ molybdopterin-dependent catalytic subunit
MILKLMKQKSLILVITLAAAILTSCGRVTVTTTSGVTVTSTVTTPGDSLDLSYLIDDDPAAVDNSQLPVTPLERMHTIGIPREIDVNSYQLNVSGLINNPLNLTYEDLMAYPREERVVLLICPLTFADNPLWGGVPLSVILATAGVQNGAGEIVLQSDDGFELPLPLEIAPDILLAYEVDGQPLTPGHGYPLRAVVKGQIGLYWLRWLTGIKIQ